MDIKESNMPVAGRLKEIIEEKGLKQAAVAKKAGYKAQDLNDMLNGRRLMRAVDIAAIINVLEPIGVDANELFKRE